MGLLRAHPELRVLHEFDGIDELLSLIGMPGRTAGRKWRLIFVAYPEPLLFWRGPDAYQKPQGAKAPGSRLDLSSLSTAAIEPTGRGVRAHRCALQDAACREAATFARKVSVPPLDRGPGHGLVAAALGRAVHAAAPPPAASPPRKGVLVVRRDAVCIVPCARGARAPGCALPARALPRERPQGAEPARGRREREGGRRLGSGAG